MSNNVCGDCRYWSELVARKRAEKLLAMCLNRESASYGMYRQEFHGCSHWEANISGAVDDPDIAADAYGRPAD